MIGTLSGYVARRFIGAFVATFLVIYLIVMLVDSVELLRAAASAENAGAWEAAQLAFLHAPSLMVTILPFLALLAAMTSFARLARSSELVVMRAAGVSVWRILAPTLAAAAILGGLSFAVLNPVASGTQQRYETLRARWFSDQISRLSISSNGLWLREASGNEQMVLRAKRAGLEGGQLWDLSVTVFDLSDRLLGRIEAGRGVLEDGAWRLYQVRRWDLSDPDGDAPPEVQADEMALPTTLTRQQIVESFQSPETISFWKLPGFIRNLENSGISATRHRMHWQGQLATPLLLAAMVLIGAAFSMRHVRFGGLGLMALGAVLTGLGYFVLANVAQAFGASGAIPAPLAAWAPPAAMSLLAIGLLLHLEDG